MKRVHLVGFWVALSLAFAACTPKSAGDWINENTREAYIDSGSVRVYYATNRSGNGSSCSDREFLAEPGDRERFGACTLNVPRQHAVGAIDTSGPYADPNRFFKWQSFASYSRAEFFSRISAEPGSDVLVFVHGFNVKYEEAVMRAAQIGYDAKFQGTIATYTWPAGSDQSGILSSLLMARTYVQNQESARETIPGLARFLIELTESRERVHLIVHSMGHQIVIPALMVLHAEGHRDVVHELILNAPDFSTSEFQSAAPALAEMATRVTLYCSPGDNALIASVRVNDNHRVGLCHPINGIDVINVHEVDAPVLGVGGLGHGYYSGRAILTDLYQLLLGVEVQNRLFIRRASRDEKAEYSLRP